MDGLSRQRNTSSFLTTSPSPSEDIFVDEEAQDLPSFHLECHIFAIYYLPPVTHF